MRTNRPKELNGRERLIVILTAMSWTRKAIAEALMVSCKTVEYHIEWIGKLLGGTDPALFTRYAILKGWLKPRVSYV